MMRLRSIKFWWVDCALTHERTRQVDSGIFELRSYAVIRAMKMRKTLLSFVFLRLEDGAKMGALRVDM
jgi:hypothetical protein